MTTLNDLPVGTLVSDPTFLHDFQGFNLRNYDSKKTSNSLIRWRVICQDKCMGDATTLMAESPLYHTGYSYLDPTFQELRDFDYSSVNSLLNSVTNSAWPSLIQETPQRFRDAIVSVSITQGGTKTNTDVRYFILSQVELGGGVVAIEGDHGKPLHYFAEGDGLENIKPTLSQMVLNSPTDALLTRSPAGSFMRLVRGILPGQTPTFFTADNSHEGRGYGFVMPVVNLRSDVPVSDFDIMGARMLFETDLKTLTLSMNAKVKGKWVQVPQMAIKKDSQWL